MAKPLNILFLSSEVEPFAKTGGLADVSGALPQAIKQNEHEIRVMMPRYGCINERRSKLHEMIRLKDIEIPMGPKPYLASVKSSFIVNNQIKVQTYFLDNAHLFGRSGLYVHPDTKKDYPDNDESLSSSAAAFSKSSRDSGGSPTSSIATTGPRASFPHISGRSTRTIRSTGMSAPSSPSTTWRTRGSSRSHRSQRRSSPLADGPRRGRVERQPEFPEGRTPVRRRHHDGKRALRAGDPGSEEYGAGSRRWRARERPISPVFSTASITPYGILRLTVSSRSGMTQSPSSSRWRTRRRFWRR